MNSTNTQGKKWDLAGHMSTFFNFYLLVIPAIGCAVYGPLIYRFREAKGHSVPEVMEAVVLHGGRIRQRVAVIK
jgi:chloride channel protein, CIC family